MVLNLIKKIKKTQKFNIGLDITQNKAIATVLKNEENIFGLKTMAYKQFAGEIMQNGQIINPKLFVETMKGLVEENDFGTNLVSISLPGNVVFIKTFTVPDLPEEELRIIASQEASKHIPLKINEVNMDFKLLESSRRVENAVKKVDVILVAAQKSIIKSHIDLLDKAGLTVVSVDVAPFAVMKTIAESGYIDDPDSLYVSVLIGYESTDITLIANGIPLFLNNIPIGKKGLVEALTSGLEIDKPEVEAMLPETAIAIHADGSLEGNQNSASVIARGVYSSILNEVQKTIEFYYSQNHEKREIKKIVLSGSGVCLQNLDKFFSNRFKVETILCNSIKRIRNNFEYQDIIQPINIPELSTSIGLALKGLER